MRIAVLVKEVPDTYGERAIDLETGLADRTGDMVLDEITERAVEAALQLRDAQGEGHVDLISVCPESAVSSIRRGLAMGADEAVVVTDDGLIGADLTMTAQALAGACAKQQYDLIIAGNLSTDGSGGVIPTMVAEHLDVPQLTNVSSMDVSGDTITATRLDDDANVALEAQLPAVVSITEAFPDARFPNFKGLRAAKKKPVTELTLADIGIDADDFTHPRAIMVQIDKTPAREAGTIVTDEGDGSAATALAQFLADNRLV